MKIKESGDIPGITQAVEAKMIRFGAEASSYKDGEKKSLADPVDRISQALLEEYDLHVFSGERELFHQTCTPDRLPCLVLGHLLTEGWIRSGQDVEALDIKRDIGTVEVTFSEDCFSKRHLRAIAVEGAGRPGAESLYLTAADRIFKEKYRRPDWDESWIRRLYRRFCEDTDLHRATRSTHSAFLMYEGRIVAEAEDIGRHNAVDKVVGYAMLHRIPLASCILFTTGRLPEDMVMKAARAGIPVLASKEVPTTAGIRAAREAGITIIGKVREHSMVLYTEAEVS